MSLIWSLLRKSLLRSFRLIAHNPCSSDRFAHTRKTFFLLPIGAARDENLAAAEKQRHKHPTAGSLDSQSVKTTSVASSRGFDAGKKIQGRKRHLLAYTLGLIIIVVVTTACVQDRDGLMKLLCTVGVHRKKLLWRIWVDGGYHGEVIGWVRARFRYCLQIVLRTDDLKGFVVLPKRWIVERTFAWLSNHRRLSKDYERHTKTSETMIHIAMTRLMLRRLKPL